MKYVLFVKSNIKGISYIVFFEKIGALYLSVFGKNNIREFAYF
jgi:hypothetical protein